MNPRFLPIAASTERLPHLLAPRPAQAAETKVVTGVIGTYAAGVWPLVIGMKKGMCPKRELNMDIIFVPNAAGLIQQLTTGSLDFVAGVGVVEPLIAVEKGAPVALMRIVGQSPSYEMIANKNIASLKDLKGKRVSVGGLRTNDKVYLDHMMAANGLKDGDYDIIVIGATAQSVPALQSGGIDAALFVPPFNFVAARLGGNKVNRDVDKAKEDMAALRVDAATLGDDGVKGLSRKFEQLTDETKVMVTDAVKTLNKDVGHGLSTYNAKVQDFADRLPGDFGNKATRFPWVTITMSLAAGFLLGVLLKPRRQLVG